MDPLLAGSHSLVADVSAVIVVIEEDEAGDIIRVAEYSVMSNQYVDPLGIVLWTIRRAGAISILRDHNISQISRYQFSG